MILIAPMKKTFSALLIATFVAYAAFARQSGQTPEFQAIAIAVPTTEISVPAAQEPIPAPEPEPTAPIVVSTATSTPKTTAVAATPAPTPVATPAPTTTPTPTPDPVPTPAPVVVASKPTGAYKDGTYTGTSVNAYYGSVQVAAVIANGALSDVQILDYPQNARTSKKINAKALPILVSEAIQAQSSSVNAVSGASATSPAFKKSLASALALAKN